MNPPPPSFTVKTSSVPGFSGDIYPEGRTHLKIVEENKKKVLEAKITTCVDGFCICNRCHSNCDCSRPSYISNLEDEREGGVWELDCKDVWHLSHYE